MSVSRTALIVVRIINALMRSSDFKPHILSDKFGEFAKKANLTDEDIKDIADVIVAITLMTNANVATVRDPSLYHSGKADRLSRAMSPKLKNLAVEQLGLNIRLVATKKQYEIANKIFMDSRDTIITNKDMQDFLRNMDIDVHSLDLMTDLGKAVKDDKRPGILYRGLKNMSPEVWKLLLDCYHEGFDFDIGKGAASFSRDRKAAETFMSGMRPILMIMKNPKKKGIPAEKLSHWGEEEETIITEGKIRVDGYKMTGTCKIVVGNEKLGQRGEERAAFTIYSDDEITIRRPSTNQNKPVTVQTSTSNEEGGAVDGRWFVKNIVTPLGDLADDVKVPLFDAKQSWDNDYWAEVLAIEKDWILIVNCTLI